MLRLMIAKYLSMHAGEFGSDDYIEDFNDLYEDDKQFREICQSEGIKSAMDLKEELEQIDVFFINDRFVYNWRKN